MITRHVLTLYVYVPDMLWTLDDTAVYTAREMEKLVLASLRRFEYDVDVEHMLTERVDE